MKRITEFVKGSKDELAKVSWPTLSQALRLTVGVILVTFIVGLVIFGMDYVFSRSMRFVITQIELRRERKAASTTSSSAATTPIEVETQPVESE